MWLTAGNKPDTCPDCEWMLCPSHTLLTADSVGAIVTRLEIVELADKRPACHDSESFLSSSNEREG